jgi:N-acetylneuraminic acid mutarotase
VYSDVWISSNGKSWREVGTLPLARGRDYFAGVVVGDKLFIFGGEAAGGEKLSDVWVADLTPVLTLKTDPQE